MAEHVDDNEKLTRNLDELLQELRVTQTGVQILTAFLLTVPFTTAFETLDSLQRGSYLLVLCGAVLSTGLVVAPVAFHRALFGENDRERLLRVADRLAKSGLTTLALTMSGVVWLVFDVVTNRTAAWIALGVAVAFFAALWLAAPLLAKHQRD